ncbi:hypothetical protein Tsubulata_027359 [Turnera subulata]|uniref:Glucose/Sorbosone dehydrogenase domain-containing protein n=1 Tax=Turnera subulata TaxID=218843 RepID=A0A9Q0J3N4_9ROSI|nr:hypothetical protein Tsubulata_027359 [Turnera subulata]
MGSLAFAFLFSCMLLLIDCGSSHPLCTDSRAPFTPTTPLVFCQYNGSVCCNSTEDQALQNQFKALNVSAPGCASLLKSVLCSKCDPFSAELYRIESVPRTVPVLCNSTVSVNSPQSQSAAINFCSKVWDGCQNVSISNSPFSLQGNDTKPADSPSTLTDLWQSKGVFCNEFGGVSDNGLVCFDGGPVSLNKSAAPSPSSGICLEKVGNGTYLNMVAHPDGSDRIFLSDQGGKIWLATVPAEGSGEVLGLDTSNPFLDISDEVYSDTQLGLMGIAFHPHFQQNGRFFASFNCDKVKWPQCSGRCSCNSDNGCDPSKLPPDNGVQPCQYHSVIAEFSANGTAPDLSSATTARPQEVRRIFTMGLPFSTHHGGQILFGPEDGYLYFMMGDGGTENDPYDFSQNKKSLLGKIMRIDVDNIPGEKMITDQGLWGNYSIPEDNPFSIDKDLEPEIWALGLRNPWRCSFDADRPSYFLCADVGQDLYEEVDIVSKGGNYGWRNYEGPFLVNPPSSPGGNVSASSINFIFPVMGYNHSEIKNYQGAASITGGYFYRSLTDPCLNGRYLYSDLYAGIIWAGTENPQDSGNFTTSELPLSCARDSPIQCTTDASGSSLPALGFVFSFGQDNRKDIFILSSNGVYRIARPSRCNYTCSKENATAYTRPSPPPSTPTAAAAGERLSNPNLESYSVRKLAPMSSFSLSATSTDTIASSIFSLPLLPLTNGYIYTAAATTTTTPRIPKTRCLLLSATKKDVWSKNPKHFQEPVYLDRSINMQELQNSIAKTHNEQELYSLLSRYKDRQLSIRFMVSLLTREPDWQRSLAILDWINDVARYSPSLFAYNVALRNVLRAEQWEVAHGLFEEMRERGLAPDRYTYSMLITQFGKAGMFDSSLFWLQKMEQDRVSGDLVLYSNLIELSRKLCDYSKAISIFKRLKRSGITPDLVVYNSMINVFGKAKFFREARLLIKEMKEVGVMPVTGSYSTLLSVYVENEKFVEALSVFAEMKEAKCPLDLMTCNVMIDVYGQLDMAKEADTLFWSMGKLGIEPNVVSYNTILKVYGEAELFGEAIHLFRLMQSKEIEQNVVTYNTMIKIYGKALEHEKASNLVQEMQKRGIEPDAVTYSTIISIWGKSGKLDKAAMLFEKLRSSGVEIDQVLYQTMIVAYEKAGLVSEAKRLLHELKCPDDIPRETAIKILARAGRIEEATWVFRQAFDAGEVKDISVFGCMIDLFSRNKKHANVIEVFEKMREADYFPDSNVIALVLNAYGKLCEFEKADAVYRKMQEEECIFPDEVHFQMLSLYGARRDFEMVKSLSERLKSDPKINKKELHLVVATIYERADRVNNPSRSRIMNRIRKGEHMRR